MTKETPTYKVGQNIALRWAQDPTTGLYLLLRANGSPQGATWSPSTRHSMILPRRLTLWAEITHRHGEQYTLQIPGDLGRAHITLTLDDLAACDAHAIEQ